MTSEEIRGTGPYHTNAEHEIFWLREIALQLALFVEHLREADAAVFGTAPSAIRPPRPGTGLGPRPR